MFFRRTGPTFTDPACPITPGRKKVATTTARAPTTTRGRRTGCASFTRHEHSAPDVGNLNGPPR